MAPPREPVFLERQTYRRRRLMDAARVLPVLGAVLFMVPMLWFAGLDARSGPAETAPMDGGAAVTAGAPERPGTANGGLYVFGVWTLLILAAAAMARPLSRSEGPVERPGGPR
ncbi:hypothetical protein [Oceaniglobus roseus]|uniref:hypothetical protein n=1 Tax=Oceaniglobus roseus TaxID=1737570 RepID=UPI000C7F6F49|nr:hypothetical protein [Kandeliimicrobium roseum]